MSLLNLSLLKKEQRYILGLSGGADSVALFHLLRENNISFEVVHFNHNLRNNAKNDEHFCNQLCQKFDIKLKIVSLKFCSSSNLENQARQKRLEFYQKKYPKQIVLLAHHQADCRENFIIRLLRGSNSSGLTGLREEKVINQTTYLRPLLGQEPQKLRQYLQKNNYQWCEDQTNKQNIYLRNKIRNQILPQLVALKDTKSLNHTLKFCQEDALFLEQKAYEKFSSFENKKHQLSSLPMPLFSRFIMLIFQDKFKTSEVSYNLIKRIYQEIHKPHKQSIQVPLKKDILMTLEKDNVFFHYKPTPFEKTWDLEKNSSISIGHHHFSNKKSKQSESFATSCITQPLKIRLWKKADKMIPFGKTTPTKVKDLFINAKIPLYKRAQIPLVIHKEQIIWIPSVARANFGLINPSSKSFDLSYEYS